jgi:hypothetical protein
VFIGTSKLLLIIGVGEISTLLFKSSLTLLELFVAKVIGKSVELKAPENAIAFERVVVVVLLEDATVPSVTFAILFADTFA